MQSTRWSSEIRQLFHETQIRYPNQKLEPDTIKAYMQDWREMCAGVGFERFAAGVKRARSYCNFFPMLADIEPLIPLARNDNAALQREMRELRARQLAGEKFYTLADVLIDFRRKVEAGEIKSLDERGQKALQAWAKALRNSEKEYAARMLAESDKKRPKSEFKAVGDVSA